MFLIGELLRVVSNLLDVPWKLSWATSGVTLGETPGCPKAETA